jgi:hypothetical protein
VIITQKRINKQNFKLRFYQGGSSPRVRGGTFVPQTAASCRGVGDIVEHHQPLSLKRPRGGATSAKSVIFWKYLLPAILALDAANLSFADPLDDASFLKRQQVFGDLFNLAAGLWCPDPRGV